MSNDSRCRGPLRRAVSGAIVAAVLFLTSGCAGVVKSTADEVSVDTGQAGTLMPRSRHWFAWLKANEHCAAHGKSPELHGMSGSVVTYRCVADPERR